MVYGDGDIMKNVRILLMIFVVSLFFGWGCNLENTSGNRVCFGENCISVEIARTPEEQAEGLQFREKLDKTGGMLFIFSSSEYHGFWMKDTLIPLDIIWIDDVKKIICIKKNVQPCKIEKCPGYYPADQARYVLEINARYCDELGLAVGDVAEFVIDIE